MNLFRKKKNFIRNEIDPDQIVAHVADGILTIKAPAAKKVEPKKIAVQVR